MTAELASGAGEPPRRISAEAPLSIGQLLYLGSLGLIAAGIVAVFFGTGFSLLAPTAGGMSSGAANRAGSGVVSLPPPLGNDKQQTFFGQAPAPENKDAAQRSAALPAPTEAATMDRKDEVPHLDGIPISKALTDTSAVPVNAPVLAPNSPAETAPAPPTPGLSQTEIAELLEHGDALLRNGDFASARLFYERAASAGDGRAALRLGVTFDAEFLGRLGLGKLQANPAEARLWYSRARDLGVVDAKRRLNSVETSRGNSLQ
ncbi:MAG: sel1 repeat family protein [Alphaproteobacteria bacterium]|nr:sel1 repeat family protein [Alphaproteobacteria bacterium]